jgi:hypothetical protein
LTVQGLRALELDDIGSFHIAGYNVIGENGS